MSKISDTGIEEQQKAGSSESGSSKEEIAREMARVDEILGGPPDHYEHIAEPSPTGDSTPPERESPIPLSVDLEEADRIADELLREHPPYDGPHDSNPTVEENAARLLRKLVKRLTPAEPRPAHKDCVIK